MRLLIVTQVVDLDNPALGFFHTWIKEFAAKCESVSVICLQEGRHDLPENVKVFSLGKESGASRIKYLLRFYKYIWSLRNHYDAVFVHMNPEYVVLAGWWWRMNHKRIVMWYVHRQKTLMLSIASWWVNVICTTAKESISIQSPKIQIVGHGIDVARYASHTPKQIDAVSPRIVSVGRITPIKHLEVIIEAIALLRQQGIQATLDLVGEPSAKGDEVYRAALEAQITKLSLDQIVTFVGAIKNADMPEVYPKYDFSVNACPTGGIDKTVLESMAAGTIPLVCNVAFRSYFESLSDELIFEYMNVQSLVDKVVAELRHEDIPQIQIALQVLAHSKADVTVLVERIIGYLS